MHAAIVSNQRRATSGEVAANREVTGVEVVGMFSVMNEVVSFSIVNPIDAIITVESTIVIFHQTSDELSYNI
jgi:hypothetical protein